MRRILDTRYKKVNLNKIMIEQCQHLTATDRHRILHLLNKFEDLFDGTLGTWKTTTVDLELKDDAKPVCLRPYPVPKAHETMFKKEVERIFNLGLFEESNDSNGDHLLLHNQKENVSCQILKWFPELKQAIKT